MTGILIAAVVSAWTNTAGRVITAEPVRIVGQKVVMETVTTPVAEAATVRTCQPVSAPVAEAATVRDGRTVGASPTEKAYPLSVFMVSEQKRIRRALGEYELPRKAAEVRMILAADLARAEARAKAGRMTPEALAEKRKVIAGAWAHELEKHGLNEKEREYWKGRLSNVGL